MFLTAEFRMSMQMTPEFNQLRQQLIEALGPGGSEGRHATSNARKRSRSAIGPGGQRRTCANQAESR